jgi:hypothetical protein
MIKPRGHSVGMGSFSSRNTTLLLLPLLPTCQAWASLPQPQLATPGLAAAAAAAAEEDGPGPAGS